MTRWVVNSFPTRPPTMKIAFRILLALTLLPVLLTLAGEALWQVAGCSGMDHLETCKIEWLRTPVYDLMMCFWVALVVVPIGVVLMAILGVVALVRKKVAHKSD